MTLITSMRAKHGAIILADSQETAIDRHGREFKYAVPKSEPESIRGFHYVVAGGGDGAAIDELAERFKRALMKSKCQTLGGFRDLFERCLRSELKAIEKDAELLVIVASFKGSKWQVWRNARSTLVVTRSDIPTLVGFDADIYKHIASELFLLAANTAQIVLVGLRVLELARRSSTSVSPPYLGVAVLPSGIHSLSKDVLAELTESLVLFGVQLDTLLLACADTSFRKQPFASLMDEFKQHAVRLRTEYLQAVAEKDFLATWQTGKPSGIPLLPNPSIRTAGYDGKRHTVKVEEL